jgi:lipoprotein NlpI
MIITAALVLTGLTGLLSAAELPKGISPNFLENKLREAIAQHQQGKTKEALATIDRVLTSHPEYAQAHFVRGQIHADADEHAKAIADYDQAIRLDPSAHPAYQQRGGEHFALGHIEKSLADFDKYLELNPGQAPHHWQRGISLYYAKRYTEGRKQFELHQTVNTADVENAVWHFLCTARESGIKRARELLIPIQGDSRVPMMQVHALFAQKLKPEDVLAAARANNPPPPRLKQQLFYANLYLGLYYEALGEAKPTRDYIYQAAAQSKDYGYMGAVARVHAEILRKEDTTPKPAK